MSANTKTAKAFLYSLWESVWKTTFLHMSACGWQEFNVWCTGRCIHYLVVKLLQQYIVFTQEDIIGLECVPFKDKKKQKQQGLGNA